MPASTRSGPSHVFRPRSAAVAAVAWAVVTVGWAWLALRDGGPATLVRQIPGMVLGGTLVHVVLVRPSVAVDARGVRLRNPLRDVDVPWGALAHLTTKFALTLHTTDGRRLSAWAAPASGRHADTRLTAGDVRALGWDPDDEPPTASASTASPSGVAAAWVRREWSRALADGPAHADTVPDDAAGGAGVSVRTARGPVVCLVASAVLTLVSVLA